MAALFSAVKHAIIGSSSSDDEPAYAGSGAGGLASASSSSSSDGEAAPKAFRIELSAWDGGMTADGDGGSSEAGPAVLETEPIPADQVAALMNRAADLEEAVEADFYQRDGSLPAPTTGRIVEAPFPPPPVDRPELDIDEEALAERAREQAGPVEVVRFYPTGEQDKVTNLAVTFNQPMVAVATVEALEAAECPVVIEPEPPGRWRWTGTTTCQFEPDHRFPMATEYRVSIAAGTRSALGNVLEEAFGFEFVTPAPKWTRRYPRRTTVQTLRPRLFLGFNQFVDREAILGQTRVTVGGEAVGGALVLIDEGAVGDDAVLGPLAKAQRGRGGPRTWVAVGLSEDLPVDARVVVTVGPEVAGAEGPRTAPELSFKFRTYPPLRLQEKYPTGASHPNGSWSLVFTNPIEAATFSRDLIRVEPPIEFEVMAEAGSASVRLSPASEAGTRYTVTVDEALADIHGQTLTGRRTATFKVKKEKLYGSLRAPSGLMIMDPTVDEPAYRVQVTNYAAVRVRVFQVNPAEFWLAPSQAGWRNKDDRPPIGTLVHEAEVAVDVRENAPVAVNVALRPHLQHPEEGVGQVLVVVEPTKAAYKALSGWFDSYKNRQRYCAWIQVTGLGLAHFSETVGHQPAALAWVSDLADGAPVEGAEVSYVAQHYAPAPGEEAAGAGEAVVAGVTDAAGVLRYGAPETTFCNWISVARRGNDTVFQQYNGYMTVLDRWVLWTWDDRNLYKPRETVTVKGYLRQLQRGPDGATVPVYPDADGRTVTYTAYDGRGADIGSGEVEVNAYGAFVHELELGDGINTGTASIYYNGVGGATRAHTFQVQEFRKPEFKAAARYRPVTDHISSLETGGFAVVTAGAEYFAGGALTGASVLWTVSAAASAYAPPGWLGYAFQKRRAWWEAASGGATLGTWDYSTGSTDGDGEHELKVAYEGNVEGPGVSPITLTAEVNVQDINYQTMSASTAIVVHPSAYYVGVKSSAYWGRVDEPVNFDVVVTDINGNALGGIPIGVEVVKRFSAVERDERGVAAWVEKEELETLEWESVDGETGLHASVTPDTGGNYEFVFSVEDPEGRPNRCSASVVVQGAGGWQRPTASKRVNQEKAEVLVEKAKYEAGEVAQVLVQAPFAPAEGLVMVQSEGMAHTERFRMEERTTVLEIPVNQAWIPTMNVHVYLAGAQARLDAFGVADESLPPRPAFAYGSQSVEVSYGARELGVVLEPAHPLAGPGQDTAVTVRVTDASGASVVGAEVALAVVDDAVLSLAGYQLTSPIAYFYPHRSAFVSGSDLRSLVELLDSADLADLAGELARSSHSSAAFGGAPGGGGGRGGGGSRGGRRSRGRHPRPRKCCKKKECAPCCASAAPSQDFFCALDEDDDGWCDEFMDGEVGSEFADDAPAIGVRTNFASLAHFEGSAVTDEDGRVTVAFALPDNLTSYRVWAVAATEAQFGMGEAGIKAQLPLMVRPSPPRFLNYGDACEVALVLQNQTDAHLTVYAGFRCANAELADGHTGGYKVEMPAGARGAVTFPIATVKAGTARLQFVGAAGEFADAAECAVPVYTPATAEAFATYGDVAGEDDVVFQAVTAPEGVFEAYGGLEVTTSSTALQALTDALVYLYSYEFECTEQLSSKNLAIVALRPVLEAFAVEDLPAAAELDAHLGRDLETLAGRQHRTGGFGMWTASYFGMDAYMSVHAAHLVARCCGAGAGVAVPEALATKCRNFVANIETFLRFSIYFFMGRREKNSIIAYALCVRHVFGEDVAWMARDFYRRYEHPATLSLEALAWLAVAMSGGADQCEAELGAIFDVFEAHVTETAETANFVVDYGDNGAFVLLHSNRRTDALVLDAYLACRPGSDLVAKVAKGLLKGRVGGRWSSTQENCFVLLALEHYFRVREAEEPDFTARVWFGQTYAGEAAFAGRSTDSHLIRVPMAAVLAGGNGGDGSLVVHRDGPGRLYYRVGLKYAPADLNLAAANYGFRVRRWYEGVASDEHAVLDGDGVWRLKLGEQIRVRLEMVTTDRRYHVALVDRLPAGLEALNAALKGTAAVPADQVGPEEGVGETAWSPFTWRYRGPGRWHSHTNIRDERVEAFANIVWPGVHRYAYVAAATTAGTFIVPPAKAEEMYSPEVFGRSATETVVVE